MTNLVKREFLKESGVVKKETRVFACLIPELLKYPGKSSVAEVEKLKKAFQD